MNNFKKHMKPYSLENKKSEEKSQGRQRRKILTIHRPEIGLKIFVYLVLCFAGVLFLIPFYLMATGGFKENYEIVTTHQTLLPQNFQLAKYIELFSLVPFLRNLFNSFFVSTITTMFVVFLSSLAGFAFAKYQFPGKNILFLIILGTMMLPFFTIIIPLFTLLRKLHWLNTYYGLIIPRAVLPFSLILMRQYIAGAIPDDILNAAKLDGCSDFQVFWKVVLPCIIPGMTVLGILTFMSIWNDFLWPLIIINTKEMFTVSLTLAGLAQEGPAPRYGVTLAGCTLGALPVIIIFLIFQRKFISSIMSGFMKG